MYMLYVYKFNNVKQHFILNDKPYSCSEELQFENCINNNLEQCITAHSNEDFVHFEHSYRTK